MRGDVGWLGTCCLGSVPHVVGRRNRYNCAVGIVHALFVHDISNQLVGVKSGAVVLYADSGGIVEGLYRWAKKLHF